MFEKWLKKKSSISAGDDIGADDSHQEEQLDEIGAGKFSQSDPKETTRSHIAQLYVWAFFIVVAVVFVIGCVKDFSVDDYKDMLVTVSGILSGPLGFIVGYYFKASSE